MEAETFPAKVACECLAVSASGRIRPAAGSAVGKGLIKLITEGEVVTAVVCYYWGTLSGCNSQSIRIFQRAKGPILV